MKKNMLIVSVACALLPAACHKDKPIVVPGYGYWLLDTGWAAHFNETRYTVSNTSRTVNRGYDVFSATDSLSGQADSLHLWFKKMPVASGQYKIVYFPNNTVLEENEVGITLNMVSRGVFTSIGLDHHGYADPPPVATLIVTNGKIKATIPQIEFEWTNHYGVWDSSGLAGAVVIER